MYLVQVRYFPAAKNIVDVFQEDFFDNLSVVEEESCRFVFYTGLVIKSFQI